MRIKKSEFNVKWQSSYLWMLIANAVYIVIFYLIMRIFV